MEERQEDGAGGAITLEASPPVSKGAPRGSRMVAEEDVLYENCVILSPDGEILSRCGKKKVEWYLKKGLAGIYLSLLPPPSAPATPT